MNNHSIIHSVSWNIRWCSGLESLYHEYHIYGESLMWTRGGGMIRMRSKGGSWRSSFDRICEHTYQTMFTRNRGWHGGPHRGWHGGKSILQVSGGQRRGGQSRFVCFYPPGDFYRPSACSARLNRWRCSDGCWAAAQGRLGPAKLHNPGPSTAG